MLEVLVGAQTSQVEEESACNLSWHLVAAAGLRLLLLNAVSSNWSTTQQPLTNLVAPAIPVWLQLAALATRPSYDEEMWEFTALVSQETLRALKVGYWYAMMKHQLHHSELPGTTLCGCM